MAMQLATIRTSAFHMLSWLAALVPRLRLLLQRYKSHPTCRAMLACSTHQLSSVARVRFNRHLLRYGRHSSTSSCRRLTSHCTAAHASGILVESVRNCMCNGSGCCSLYQLVNCHAAYHSAYVIHAAWLKLMLLHVTCV